MQKKMLLDCWEKLPLQDVLIIFFIHGSVLGQNFESAHSLGWKATPHMDLMVSGCSTVGTTQD